MYLSFSSIHFSHVCIPSEDFAERPFPASSLLSVVRDDDEREDDAEIVAEEEEEDIPIEGGFAEDNSSLEIEEQGESEKKEEQKG